jgi:hypothetical protein
LNCEFLQKKGYSYKIVRAHIFDYMKIGITLSQYTGTPRSNFTARMKNPKNTVHRL